MSYAIVRTGGKQFRVTRGDTLRVPLLNKPAGETLDLELLAFSGEDGTKVGASLAGSERVAARVIGHGRGTKVIVFKKKRRKHYKRKQGHRQDYTTLKIDSIG